MSDVEKQHDKCMKVLEYTMVNNTKVHKLIDAISNLGCKLPSDFLLCRPCDAEISGGFVASSNPSQSSIYKPQIVMCENKTIERETFENTVIHELVHAYDQCRAKLDWKNCLHHACTEVRASSISGECNFIHEVFRGNKTILKGQQECALRRAEKSVSMNPYCKDVAKDAVKAVFAQCYNDIEPFDLSEMKK